MTDRELLKEARNLIVMCSLLDKSGQCEGMADKIDEHLATPAVSDRRELLLAVICEYNKINTQSEICKVMEWVEKWDSQQ